MTRRRHTATLALGAVAAALAGCASKVSDRVVLLSAGNTSVQVSTGGQSVTLAQPYATAERAGDKLSEGRTSAEEVRARYGSLLDGKPVPPRSFIVYFEASGARLTADAPPVLEELKRLLAQVPAPEVIVIGHTDRVGSVEANDRLSLQRAGVVRDLLAAAGVKRELISTVGRGEREPLVATADEVAEARNRRVEIKIR